MSSDPGEFEAPAPKPAYDLPDVVGVETRRVAHEPPRRRNFASSLPRVEEAVEFLVETAAPIPVRALSPVLYVGDTPVVEVTAVDDTHYRFLGLEPDRLEPGAPLSLGWSGRAETEPRRTRFRFEG